MVAKPKSRLDATGNRDEAFASRLRDALAHREQTWLSRETGIPVSTIGEHARGLMPRADKAATIAKALGVQLDWLVSGLGPKVASNALVLAEAGDIDWVMLPRYDLGAFTPEGKPTPVETIPVAKHWLNRNWYASSGLWLTAMPPTHHESMPPEGTDILIRDAAAMTEAGTYLFFYNGVPLIRRFLDTGPSGWAGMRDGAGIIPFDEPEGMRIVGRILGSMQVNPL